MRQILPSIGQLTNHMVTASDLGEEDTGEEDSGEVVEGTPGAYGWTAVLYWADEGQAMENAENWATWGIAVFKFWS
jgi:hypothetical protein